MWRREDKTMSHKKAKRIRNALFNKGIPVTTGKYYLVEGRMIVASQERRIYKALKKKPIKEALEIVSKLSRSKRPTEKKA